MTSTFRRGGIHPPENKTTSGSAIIEMPLPRRVTLSMSQHIGNAAIPVVKRGDHVQRLNLVGKADGYVSANIHTPVSGTVRSVDMQPGYKGTPSLSVVIEADDADHNADLCDISDARPVRDDNAIAALTPAEIIGIVRDNGIVGLGGATFPTHVKLAVPKGKHADIFIANGAECEPYLTCDDRIMREQSAETALGIELLRRACGAAAGIVAIEANKPEAIRAMRAAIHPYPALSIRILKTKYPQGGEKQLINAVTGRDVPEGGLPIDAGAVVDNVATALATYHAAVWGIPLVERVVTVGGPGAAAPGNYRVPTGTSLADIITRAGGLPDGTGKVIIGGPMMGQAASDLDAPATKGVSGIIIVPERDARRHAPYPCIRCARCVSVCPMGLEPYLIATLSVRGRSSEAAHYGLASCIECGSCSYICPSYRPITDCIRAGKAAERRKR